MNTPIDSFDAARPADEADVVLGEWIREAGDVSMQPRPEHVMQLKERLLAQSNDAPAGTTAVASPVRQRSLGRGWLWVALTGAAAVLVISLLPTDRQQNAAWAQVQDAVNSKPWLHVRTTLQDGMVVESWFAPRRLIAGMRFVPPPWVDLQGMTPFAMFIDFRQGARFEYQPQSNEIVKSPLYSSDEASMRMVIGFITAFADKKGFAETVEANPDVAITAIRNVEVDGQVLREFDTVIRFQGHQSTGTFRVDPATNLPVSSTMELEGNTQISTIDFPDEGPASIYELGINAAVAIQDRMPASELSRLLDERQRARMNFDRYYGISVQVPPNRQWWNSVSVNRIWRDGMKWRTEYMIWDPADLERIQNRPAPPEGTDPLTWLSAQVDRERFRLTQLSDGINTWRVEYDVEESDTKPARWTYVPKPIIQNPYPIDPANPLPMVFTSPEFLAYGPTGLPSSRRLGILTLEPDDGPAGTVKIESRTTGEPRPESNDLSYYWVDPLENGMMRKTQMLSLAGDARTLLGEQTVLGTARSPSGYLYPTQLMDDGGSVTHFYLDFAADFDDSVFNPISVDKAPSSH